MPSNHKINGGVAVIENNGRHLLIRQPKNKPFPGKWMLPGGRLEKGESIINCIKREIKEELGIEIEEVNPNPLFITKSYWGTDFGFFKVSAKNFDIKIDEKEVAEVAWFSLDEIKKLDLMEATKEFYNKLWNINH